MRFLLLFCLLLCSAQLSAQQWRLLHTIELPENTESFAVDRLNQLYTLSQNSIQKYSAEGKLESEYRENNKGKIQLDVSNPMQPIAFFPEYGYISTLDRTMSETQAYDFLQEYWTAFALSSDGAFWLYSSVQQKLLKIAPNSPTPLRSSFEMGLTLENILGGTQNDIYFDYCREHDGKVYLYNSETGFLAAFDLFCNLDRYWILPAGKQLHFLGDHLYFLQEGEIQARSLQQQNSILPADKAFSEQLKLASQMAIQQNRLYLRIDRQVFCYIRRDN